MNCPSRTDDDILWHPGWNQNPPRFAPDLTTCADLNGIANARELGEADRLCNPQNLRPCNPYHVNGQEIEKDKPITMGEGAKGSPKGEYFPLQKPYNIGCAHHADVFLSFLLLQDLAPEQPRM